jgi:hypothetical protein
MRVCQFRHIRTFDEVTTIVPDNRLFRQSELVLKVRGSSEAGRLFGADERTS